VRILHLVHQYLPEYVGGTELYTQTLARFQAQQGHHVAIFHPSQQEATTSPFLVERDEAGVTLYRAPVGPRSRGQVFLSNFRDPALLSAFKQLLKSERPDLIHVQHLMGLPFQILQTIEAAGIPFVITLHDYWFPCANGQLITNYDNTVCGGPEWWLNCARCALARSGIGDRPWLAPAVAPLFAYRSQRLQQWLRTAGRVIAPTRFVRDIYAQLNMPDDNVVVVPHGIEVPKHVLQASPPQLPHQAGQLHVVYVSSLAHQKGTHVLIEAMNKLPLEITLTLYGDLDKFPDYVRMLKEKNRHPGVRFAGRIGREDFWQMLLTEADVAVLPTLWYETSSLIRQELSAARVPLVASDIGVLAETIRDGVDGLLFPPGDAQALAATLERLHREPHLLRQLQSNMRPTRLMSEHLIDVQSIYEEVLQQAPLPTSTGA
jgi:glycosyltransferase involved in cell wall biosynthesis